MTQSEVFNYPLYQADVITKFLADHDDLPGWFREYLLGTTVGEQDRDDALEDYLSAQTYVPSLAVVRPANQAVTDTTGSVIEFSAIDFQSTELFDWDVGDPTKLTVTDSGIVLVLGSLSYRASAAGDFRTAQLFLNGAVTGVGSTVGPLGGNGDPAASTGAVFNLVAGDYVTLFSNQNSGGALNAYSARLSLSYLGKNNG